jgi:4-amino-4-deoxy-L-arabinose transferase-like glycosyltransferase
MRVARALQLSLGITLCLVGLSGILIFGRWQNILFGISPDGQITGYSWIMLRIMMIALLAPGALLILPNVGKRWLSTFGGLINALPERKFLFYGLAIAAALRTGWVLLAPLRLYADWLTYDELGWHMAQAGELATEHGLTTYRPPGYPFLLASLYKLFGHEAQLAVAANVIIGVAIVYLAYRLTKRIWDEHVARWAFVFMCVFPSQVLFINFVCSEPLFTLLFLIALLIYVERPASPLALAVSGAVFGLATLVRSIAMLVPIMLLPFMWRSARSRGRAMAGMAAIFAGLLAVTVPWVIRNYSINGRATISTTGGVDFYIGNNSNTAFGFNKPDPKLFPFHGAADEARNDSLGYALGWEYIRNEPLAFVWRGLLKTGFLMLSDTEGWAYDLIREGSAGRFGLHGWLGVAVQSFYYVFLLLTLAGLWFAVRSRPFSAGSLMIIAVIVYWLAVHFVFFAEDRYHYPIVPLMAGFASLAAYYFAHGRIRGRETTPLSVPPLSGEE